MSTRGEGLKKTVTSLGEVGCCVKSVGSVETEYYSVEGSMG